MIPTSFSKKQKLVLQWWAASSPERERDALICDGAVPSGKTVEAVRRNMLVSVLPVLGELGFS